MKIIGIDLRKPTFNELTYAALIACVWWLASIGLWKSAIGPLDRVDAGAALLVIYWGCICARIGIRVDRGARHLALNMGFCALILTSYQGAVSLFS